MERVHILAAARVERHAEELGRRARVERDEVVRRAAAAEVDRAAR
jgi:hypothetical protein